MVAATPLGAVAVSVVVPTATPVTVAVSALLLVTAAIVGSAVVQVTATPGTIA